LTYNPKIHRWRRRETDRAEESRRDTNKQWQSDRGERRRRGTVVTGNGGDWWRWGEVRRENAYVRREGVVTESEKEMW